MRRSGNGRPAGEEDEADNPGPLDRETREKRLAQKTHGLDGPARVASACERRGASGAGWAKGRVCRKVGRAESEEKEFLN
jgi:hypothetical protein